MKPEIQRALELARKTGCDYVDVIRGQDRPEKYMVLNIIDWYEQVLRTQEPADQTEFTPTAEQWKALEAKLNAPARMLPALKKLLEEPAQQEGRKSEALGWASKAGATSKEEADAILKSVKELRKAETTHEGVDVGHKCPHCFGEIKVIFSAEPQTEHETHRGKDG